jgi:hypothetical protein
MKYVVIFLFLYKIHDYIYINKTHTICLYNFVEIKIMIDCD